MTASAEITGSTNLEYCSKHFDRFKKKKKKKTTRHSLTQEKTAEIKYCFQNKDLNKGYLCLHIYERIKIVFIKRNVCDLLRNFTAIFENKETSIL